MRRAALFAATAFIALASVASSPPSALHDRLKNPTQMRVTSLGHHTVAFTLVTLRGSLVYVKGPRPPSRLHAVTPGEFVGVGEFVFVADHHQRVKVEAWRMFGEKHVEAEGEQITVRAGRANEAPEVLVGGLAVTQ
jgi:hypothetical protein